MKQIDPYDFNPNAYFLIYKVVKEGFKEMFPCRVHGIIDGELVYSINTEYYMYTTTSPCFKVCIETLNFKDHWEVEHAGIIFELEVEELIHFI